MTTRKARMFYYHFNRFGHKRGDPDIWTVHVGGKNHHVRKVICDVWTETVYKGDSAPQPRAVVRGKGVVRFEAGAAFIDRS